MGRCAGVRYRRGTNDPRLRRSVLRPIDGTARWTGADHRERGRLHHRKSRRTQGAGEMFDWAQLRGHGRSRFVQRCGRLRGDNPRYSRKQTLDRRRIKATKRANLLTDDVDAGYIWSPCRGNCQDLIPSVRCPSESVNASEQYLLSGSGAPDKLQRIKNPYGQKLKS
jgi:hypothetical protein